MAPWDRLPSIPSLSLNILHILVVVNARVSGSVVVTLGNMSIATNTTGYTWIITFPLSAGDAPELGIDGTALEGGGAAGNIIETQSARIPEKQRVSTSASSGVSGWFTLKFDDETTMAVSHNASAEEVRATGHVHCRLWKLK